MVSTQVKKMINIHHFPSRPLYRTFTNIVLDFYLDTYWHSCADRGTIKKETSFQLFSSILKVLQRESALDKVVLLGDIFQLPSITPGNFMSDVFNALQCRELAVKLNTNHRSEGSIIFDNADRVKERKMPMFDRCRL